MRALRRRSLAATPLALLLGLLLPAAQPRAEQLPVKTYTTADGLSQDRVKRIVRDTRGFLWFCTADGLSRFDGYRFTSYDAGRGLPHPSVNDLLETRGGTYWVATNGGGVMRFNPRSGGEEPGATPFAVYAVGDRPRTNRVNKLYEDGSGGVWAGTDDGLFMLEGDASRFRRVDLGGAAPAGAPLQVWDLLEDGERNLWLGTTAGLLRRAPDGQVSNFPVEERGARNVWDLMKDGEGRFWVSYAGGLLVFNPASGVAGVRQPWRELSRTAEDVRGGRVALPSGPGEAYRYTSVEGLAGDDVQASYQTRDRRVWVVTSTGLTVLDGGRFRSYTTAHGLSENTLLSLAEDRDNNIWIGTYSGGAMKLTPYGLTTYRREDGLSESVIGDIFEDQAGELCVAGRRFIDRFDGKKFSPVRPNLPAEAATFQHVIQDHAGEWWFAAAGSLYRFPRSPGVAGLASSRPRRYTAADGLGGEGARRLFEDSRGDIWIGTGGRDVLSRWERATGQFHRYSKADGLPEYSRPLSFSEDAHGGVWVAFREGGLARYGDGRFTVLTSADDLPAGAVTKVFTDAGGRLWAAVTFGGLVRIDDPGAARPRLRAYTTVDGLTSNITRSVAEDKFGRLYVGTTRSVDRLDPADGKVRHYTVADGLASNESNTSYAGRDGALWFGTWNGLSRLWPTPERTNSAPPPVMIGGLSVAGESRPLSDLGETEVAGLHLGDTQNQVRVDFFGLSFAPGEVLRYQYMLEGAGGDWGAPTEERSVTYANLRPGSYRFLVRAVNADGVASERPASVSFIIAPPVWQRWWFVALTALALAAAAHALYRLRVRRLIELERVRTRIATDLHDDIGASLSKIAILSDVAGLELGPGGGRVAEPLAQIAGTSREVVDAMSDIVWAVNPQRDHLSDLTHRMRRFASDLLGARDIEFTFRAPPDERDLCLGADLRREVYLIFKECANNLVRHSDCTEAEIEFRVAGRQLVLTVRDNGVGFDATAATGRGLGSGMGGHGLPGMRRRAEALGGTLEVESAKGAGTRVTLRVPADSRHGRWRLPERAVKAPAARA